MPPAAKNHVFLDCGLKGVPPAAKNHDLLDCSLKGVPLAAKNHDFLDCGLKGVPPAAKNHVFFDCGLKGVPPATKNHDLGDLLDNFDILSGSEMLNSFFFVRPPDVGRKYLKNNSLSLFLSLQSRDQAGNMSSRRV